MGSPVMSLTRLALTRGALGMGMSAAIALSAAADEDAIDAEFLDYLSTMEDAQEDWTWFSEQDEAQDEQNENAADEDTRP